MSFQCHVTDVDFLLFNVVNQIQSWYNGIVLGEYRNLCLTLSISLPVNNTDRQHIDNTCCKSSLCV